MERRSFLKTTTRLLSAAAIAQLLSECAKDAVTAKPPANFTIDISDPRYSDLQTVGAVLLVNDVYIVCTAQSSYIALSRVCTHQGCTVSYNSTGKNFVCPCHGGVYDLKGKVVSGPPPSALAQYQVTLSGTTLTIA
ncbi:MAG TPA: ubiquinol-cytochrome c reductase iron-sulfur subunit [Cyclobacteriaceae bacterium]|jgi:cytochrome b6-f complex iron-sulfur subunit|nr:ubiquinol-cytochrome c reductase iron-sulfur subunit [Cyclobacteriaceae bacterium]